MPSNTPDSRRAGRRVSVGGLLLLTIALGIAARAVRYGLNFPLWGDEAFVAVDFLPRDGVPREFSALLRPLTYGQIVPLGYMWAQLAVSRVLGLSEYALRFVAFAGGIAALLLFWRLARRMLNPRAALLTIGFLAAAYYPIRHGAEVKPYSTDLLVAVVLLMLGWSVYRRPTVLSWSALIVAGGLAIWCSYPAVFVLGAIGVLLGAAALKRRTASNLLTAAAFCAVVAASFLAMYTQYGRPQAAAATGITEIETWQETFPPISKFWKLPWWLFTTHAGNMLAYPQGGKTGGSIVTAALVVIGSVRLWRRRQRGLLWLLLGPLLFNFVAAALHKYPYGGTVRTSIFMAPAFCLLAGLGLYTVVVWVAARVGITRDGVQRTWGRGVAGAAIVLALFSVGSIAADLIQPYKKGANERAREVIRDVSAELTPRDQLLAFNSIEPATKYAPYIAPWKGDGAQMIFYLTCLPPVAVKWAPAAESIQSGGGRTALIVYYGQNFSPFFDQAQFDAYLAQLEARLGPAQRTQNVLQKRRDRQGNEMLWQAIDVYWFSR